MLILFAAPLWAGPLRVATWNVGLERAGPGLLLRDILAGDDPQVLAVLQVLDHLDADVILLTGIDYDADLLALNALADRMARPPPHRFALAPNSGVPTGYDIDQDNEIGPRDAQGWGHFPGAGGMALLSRLPVDAGAVRDFSGLIWADQPWAIPPPDMGAADRAAQRLATTALWDLPLVLPDGGHFSLLAWQATPPVFDGPTDRNGRRNHDESAFWLHILAGEYGAVPDRFILLGDGNLDPVRGDGRRDAITALLTHPSLQDPAPNGTNPAAKAQATAIYRGKLGALRLDYLLPDARWQVQASGVLWPPPDDPLWPAIQTASHHFAVWADLSLRP